MRLHPVTWICIALGLTAACSEDPRYLAPEEALEANAPGSDDGTGNPIAEVTTQIVLPVRLEKASEASDRADLAAELGTMVPYVTRDDLDIELEWTIRNLSDQPGTARILVNGANEYFAYIPENFIVDPDEEEPPPPLAGDIPTPVAEQSTVSGVFREDQLAEAALDLELITRGNVNPYTALLEVDEDLEVLDDGAGLQIPVEDTANLIRLDITFTADQHMIMEYAIRVRDHRRPNLIHDQGLAADPGELTAFAPADFVPVLTP